MKNKNKTAAQVYAARADRVAAMLDLLAEELAEHARRAAAEPLHWGFAGEMADAERKAIELLSIVSGMDETDISEHLREQTDQPETRTYPVRRADGTICRVTIPE